MRARVALALAALGLAGCESMDPPLELRSDLCTVRLTATPLSLEVLDEGGRTVLRGLPRRLLGTTVDRPDFVPKAVPGWDGYFANEAPWVHPAHGLWQATGPRSASLQVIGGGEQMALEVTVEGARVQLSARVLDGEANKLALAFELGPDDHMFGLGERFVSVDHRGRGLYSWAEEGALAGGESTGIAEGYPLPNGPSMTYFPVPYHYSTAGYGVHVATTRRSEVHLGDEDPGAWRVAVNGRAIDLVLHVRRDPLAALDDFTAETGRPMVPAPWVWGAWRRINRGAQIDGLDEWAQMRIRQLPITVIEDALHFLPHRSELGIEAEVAAWTSALHDAGIKVLSYNNPYVSATEPAAAGDYAEGRDRGLFERAPDGTPARTFFISGRPQEISAIDLTHPDGVRWFQGLLTRSLALGYDGWMHDFGEYVARSSRFYDGRSGEEVHNEFPVLSARAAHELLEQRRPNDYVFHVRSGYTGSAAHAPVVWGGDAEASFDETQGLPSAVRSALNLGMSGVSTWGSDLGGYKCLTQDPNDKEVYFRWLEVGAVSPIMREQDACSNPLSGNREKWKLWNDEATQAQYRAMAGLHTRLAPYFRRLAAEAHERGVPIMRHPVLYHPRQPEAWAVEDSFYLGDALYAAPVVRRGVTTRRLWLPPGRYVEWTDGTVKSGPGFVETAAPLERLPLFLIEDHMVPLLSPDVQTLASTDNPTVVSEAQRADLLDVVVALGPSGSATTTLTDGTRLSASRGHAPAPCGGCVDTLGDVSRVRVESDLAATSQLAIEDLRLGASSPIPRRIRWEVRRLP